MIRAQFMFPLGEEDANDEKIAAVLEQVNLRDIFARAANHRLDCGSVIRRARLSDSIRDETHSPTSNYIQDMVLMRQQS